MNDAHETDYARLCVLRLDPSYDASVLGSIVRHEKYERHCTTSTDTSGRIKKDMMSSGQLY